MLSAIKSSSSGGSTDDPTQLTPACFVGGTMKSAVLRKLYPYGAWGDDSTVALVMYMDVSTSSPKYPTVQAFADDVATIRTEIRVKK
jgi:hypothetical protein